VLSSGILSSSYAGIVEQDLMMDHAHTPFAMEIPVIHELPNLMDFGTATLHEHTLTDILGYPGLPNLQMDIRWSNWTPEVEIPGFAAPCVGSSLIVLDRYSKLLNPLPWFQFTDWLAPKLESPLRHSSSLSGMQTHVDRKHNEDLPVVIWNVMGLSKAYPGCMQKAVRFLSGMVPERHSGELACKISQSDTLAHAKIQAAELLLSLLANNHESMSRVGNTSQLREWIMEIPVVLLELMLQRKDTTAVAISSRLLVWSIEQGYYDVFHLLLKAKIDTTYLSGTQGGKLLLKTVQTYPFSKELFMEILKYDVSLNERTSNHCRHCT
jgi:hypothetical protein